MPTLLRNIFTLLLLSNCSLIVQGFVIRGCNLMKDKAHCSKREINRVPADIPPTIRSLDLSSNCFTKIQVSNFSNFPHLTVLDLKHNKILSIDKYAFSHLHSLQKLVLNNNQMVQLEDDVFHGLSKLVELLLGFNSIQTVAPNAFRSLHSLVKLDLSWNKLRTIGQVHLAIQHMPLLKNLQLRCNGIKTFLSSDLTNTSVNITQLDLSENVLERFEVNADVFPELTNINIGNPLKPLLLTWSVQSQSVFNHVTTLDVSAIRLESSDHWRKLLSAFNSLTFIKLNSMKYQYAALVNMSCSIPTVSKLELQSNNIFFIGSSFFQMCRNAKEIDLEQNRIKQIDVGSFSSLDRLQVLSIKRNRLSHVPNATRNVRSLWKLDLSFNLIEIIKCADFEGLTNLKQLNLQWNKIRWLNKCTFANLAKLEVLFLHGNKISDLGGAFHQSLQNLKNLLLNKNKLKVIKKHDFKGLQSLVNLSLAENRIYRLQESCFYKLQTLRSLQLEGNNLTRNTLSFGVFKDLVNLIRLNLAKNHFKYFSSSSLKQPPFQNLSRLKNLIFSVQRSKGMGYFPSNFLQGLTNLSQFICNNIQLLSFPSSFFTYSPRITDLDFSANNIMDLSPEVLSPLTHLTRLKMTSTYLRSLDPLIDSNLTKLQFLEARKNVFTEISEDLIRSLPHLLSLDVQFNGFVCDCDNSWFVQWLKNNNQTQVLNANHYLCNHPPESKNKKLIDFKVQSCLLDIGFICFVSTACANALIVMATFTYHFSRFQITYAYYLLLAWLFDSKKRRQQKAGQYDAFVSYNTHDEAWVYEQLVLRLEQEQGWKLCLHHRDFLPGKPIVENIADAIYGSRKTICVISRHYLQSEWCSKEMQLASFRLFDEREDVLILVFLEEIPSTHLSPYYRMKKILRRSTYLSWPAPSNQQLLFWEKLRQALKSRNTTAADQLLLTVTQQDSQHHQN